MFCLRCRAQRTEIACFAAELMKKGQQQEPLQDHIERLEDALLLLLLNKLSRSVLLL